MAVWVFWWPLLTVSGLVVACTWLRGLFLGCLGLCFASVCGLLVVGVFAWPLLGVSVVVLAFTWLPWAVFWLFGCLRGLYGWLLGKFGLFFGFFS